jgi:cytochrome c biogenesis protein CcmG/thiol:disulfide interchange protein DsbE
LSAQRTLAARLDSIRPRHSPLAALFALAMLVSSAAGAVGIDERAPEFRLPQLGKDGQIDLADMRGKVVFIDFWASWCSPCREAMPQYERLYASLPHDDFTIVAVNVDEVRADAEKFLAAHPVSYAIGLDPAGDVPKAYGLVGMPTSYLVDRGGVVRWRGQGFKSADIDVLRKEIDKLVKEPAHAR